MPYGLTATGYTPRRASEWLILIRQDFENRLDALGLQHDIDWTRKSFEALITADMADRLGELDEVPQGVYDAMDINNATGINLDTLCMLVAVPRLQASYSTATVTITGTAGTIIQAGNLVEGGGVADNARWLTQADATIGGGGTVDVTVRCQTIGEIAAGVGDIDAIVTPATGWTSVTNAAVASPGRNRETDTELRARRLLRLARAGSTNVSAIRANILEIEGVLAAVVIENDRKTNRVIEGKTLPGSCINAIINPNTLTTAQQNEVLEALYERAAGGARIYGTDVTGTVTGEDGFAKVSAFDWSTDLNTAVVCTVTLEPGYVIGDVQTPLQQLIIDYFAAVDVGQRIYNLDINALAATVDGIATCVTTLNGGASLIPEIYEFPVLNPTPPTVTT